MRPGSASQPWEPAPLAADRPPALVQVMSPAGEPVRPYLNPFHTLAHLWRYRNLVAQLTRRELAARYRGSALGTVWALLVPLLMLCLYTYVFSMVFKARWGTQDGGKGLVALTLFAGLVPFNMFSEVVGGAPGVIVGSANYVKRVVFPLELLPLVKFASALVQGMISAGVLVLGLAVQGALHPTLVLLPLAWLPLLLLMLGSGYFLAALGVFLRDTAQAVQVVLPFLFFLTPIVYPLEAVPSNLLVVVWLNPIAHVVEDCRRAALFGVPLNWRALALNTLGGAVVAFAGFLFFMKSKRAFHDAL